jgi:hypothetical protein
MVLANPTHTLKSEDKGTASAIMQVLATHMLLPTMHTALDNFVLTKRTALDNFFLTTHTALDKFVLTMHTARDKCMTKRTALDKFVLTMHTALNHCLIICTRIIQAHHCPRIISLYHITVSYHCTRIIQAHN